MFVAKRRKSEAGVVQFLPLLVLGLFAVITLVTAGIISKRNAVQNPSTKAANTFNSPIKTVFVILEENYPWSSIKGSSSAPYINSILPQGSYATQYFKPLAITPLLSEPEY